MKQATTENLKRDYPQKQVKALNEIVQILKKQRETSISKRRETIGSGLIALGNLSLSGLYFGQAFGGFSFDFQLASLGIVYFIVLYIAAYKLLEEK